MKILDELELELADWSLESHLLAGLNELYRRAGRKRRILAVEPMGIVAISGDGVRRQVVEMSVVLCDDGGGAVETLRLERA